MFRFIRRFRTQIVCTLLIIAALVSAIWAAPYLSKPANFRGTIAVIDDNKNQAVMLSTVVTLSSTLISTMPDDTATPLADELSELSTPLLLIVCVLLFEKYMLTSMWFVSFAVLIPIALVLYAMRAGTGRTVLAVRANKFLAVAALLCFAIPVSTLFTAMIEETFADSINTIFDRIHGLQEIFSQTDANKSGFFNFFSNLANGVTELVDISKELLGMLIDGIAVLIVTSCLIPALTLILLVLAIKYVITGRFDSIYDVVDVLRRHVPRPRRPHPAPEPEEPSERAA